MTTTDSIGGRINDTVSFHYDVFADVLYLDLVGEEETESLGNENDDGDIEMRDEITGRPIGLTIISWWKRFGQGDFPDSLRELAARIEPWAGRVAA